MHIAFNGVSKRFGQTRILSDFSHGFTAGTAYHITGANGSGKSTFLKLVCANLTPDKGTVTATLAGKTLEPEELAIQTAFCAPYIDLLDELTAREQIVFHQSFKPFLPQADVMAEMANAGLQAALDRPLRQYSSGMKQRLKLILTFLSHSPLLLLDEPCSNLDEAGRKYYASLAERYITDRLVLVASNNMVEEHFFCKEKVEPGGKSF